MALQVYLLARANASTFHAVRRAYQACSFWSGSPPCDRHHRSPRDGAFILGDLGVTSNPDRTGARSRNLISTPARTQHCV